MARFRLSGPSKADLAADPEGVSTAGRAELGAGLRSFHIRHIRHASREAPVVNPTHVLFYRALQPGLVEIVRVLHERMEPSRHLQVVQERNND